MRNSPNLYTASFSVIAAVLVMDSGLAREPSENLLQPGNLQPEVTQGKSSGDDDEKEVLRLTNKERENQGLQSLDWCPDLAKAAQTHAKDMFLDGYFSHISHDRIAGQLVVVSSPMERLLSFSARACAENIAQGQQEPGEVVARWMGSDGHRASILASDHRLCGISFAGGFWVQVFGR
jgi:uncharacterized protein YkwD